MQREKEKNELKATVRKCVFQKEREIYNDDRIWRRIEEIEKAYKDEKKRERERNCFLARC